MLTVGVLQGRARTARFSIIDSETERSGGRSKRASTKPREKPKRDDKLMINLPMQVHVAAQTCFLRVRCVERNRPVHCLNGAIRLDVADTVRSGQGAHGLQRTGGNSPIEYTV
jgi:hypothetical protein